MLAWLNKALGKQQTVLSSYASSSTSCQGLQFASGYRGKEAHMEKKCNMVFFLLLRALGHENWSSYYCGSLTISGSSLSNLILGLCFPVPVWWEVDKASLVWLVLANELWTEVACYTSMLAHIIVHVRLSRDFYPPENIEDGRCFIVLDLWVAVIGEVPLLTCSRH